jgi:spore coat protein I
VSDLDGQFGDQNKALSSLATEVLLKYGIVPENISVVQSGAIKTVWKIRSGKNNLCLKRLKQSYDKALFSVNAQIYIKKSGGNVPAVINDKTGNPIVQHKDQLFVLYEWIEGRDLSFSNSADLTGALQGLARFHIASKGYISTADARTSTKLGKWPEQYNSMKKRIIDWKGVSGKQPALSSHTAFSKYVNPIVALIDESLDLLSKTPYLKLVSEGSPAIVLCHQDYGKGNALLTDKGVFVLDLDGVTYDLPARDLRKIIGKAAEGKGKWDAESINSIVDRYSAVNPIQKEERKILYIDMLFPHWFFGLVKNQYQNNKILKADEVERMAKLELSKVAVIKSLLKDS